jgi:hypothetical protein
VRDQTGVCVFAQLWLTVLDGLGSWTRIEPSRVEELEKGDDDTFVYSIDLSNDGGETWNRGSIEFTMNRVE